MRRRILILETAVGFVILLGGLLSYGLGINELLPVPRPDLVVTGTTLIGAILIITGSLDMFGEKTKEIEIEEKDERNIAIANAAMASGFRVMNVVLSFAIFALIFMGYMNVVSCFTMIGAFLVGQLVFVFRLWLLGKKM